MKTLFLALFLSLSFNSRAQISLKDLRLTERDFKKLKFESKAEKAPQLYLQKESKPARSRFYLMAECIQFNGLSFRSNETGYDECLQQRQNSKWINMGLEWSNKK
ncbi:MAG: hypothetical protein U0T83_10130 [Bacteriovoracaceae bacterium]